MTNKPSVRTREQARAPGRRSGAQALRTRARILRAAERLFASRGYRGVSLRDLASACGLHMFTIQHHFGSKLALYREILRMRDREVEALVRRVLAEERSISALVGRVVDELFDFFLAHRDAVARRSRAVLVGGLPRCGGLWDNRWADFLRHRLRL